MGDAIEGEARDVGKVLAGIALQVAERGQPVRGALRAAFGRRNHGDRARPAAEAGATSSTCCRSPSRSTATRASTRSPATRTGSTAQEEIAGAHVAPDTLARAWALGLRPRDMLASNDAHSLFGALGRLGCHRPTLTNVNDFRAIHIEDAAKP